MSYEAFLEQISKDSLVMRLVYSVILLAVGYCVHVFFKRHLKHFFQKRASQMNSRKISTLTTFILSIMKYVLYFVIFYILCKILRIAVDSFFLAVAGASSVAIGFGAQTLVKNVINGCFILLEDQYSVGDIIIVGTFKGTVEEIGIRTTKIRSVEGNVHIIPNGEINIITNMSKKVTFAMVDINLPYNTDAKSVIAFLTDEMEKNGANIPGSIGVPQVLGINSMGQYCYTIRIKIDCEQETILSCERDVMLLVKERLALENVAMPNVPNIV